MITQNGMIHRVVWLPKGSNSKLWLIIFSPFILHFWRLMQRFVHKASPDPAFKGGEGGRPYTPIKVRNTTFARFSQS